MDFSEAKQIIINRGFVNGLFDGDKWRQSIVVISEWLKQEPCEDCISRAEALKNLALTNSKDDVYRMINSLSSVQPKPKIGRWIEHPHEAGINWEDSKYECSECHVWTDDDSDYCPNCGAKMSEIPTDSESEE